jgi:hypothetical protein
VEKLKETRLSERDIAKEFNVPSHLIHKINCGYIYNDISGVKNNHKIRDTKAKYNKKQIIQDIKDGMSVKSIVDKYHIKNANCLYTWLSSNGVKIKDINIVRGSKASGTMNEDTAKGIMKIYSETNLTLDEIAIKFNVSRGQVWSICNGITYRYLTGLKLNETLERKNLRPRKYYVTRTTDNVTVDKVSDSNDQASFDFNGVDVNETNPNVELKDASIAPQLVDRENLKHRAEILTLELAIIKRKLELLDDEEKLEILLSKSN